MSYQTRCSFCGGYLDVVSFYASTSIPVFSDGFSTADAHWMDTEEETTRCRDCGKTDGLHWGDNFRVEAYLSRSAQPYTEATFDGNQEREAHELAESWRDDEKLNLDLVIVTAI